MVNPEMLKVGGKHRFTPAVCLSESEGRMADGKPYTKEVTGRIVYINQAHRYFTVEYHAGHQTLRESIKF